MSPACEELRQFIYKKRDFEKKISGEKRGCEDVGPIATDYFVCLLCSLDSGGIETLKVGDKEFIR